MRYSRVGLHDHEPDPAELRELAGDLRAEERLHGLEHVAAPARPAPRPCCGRGRRTAAGCWPRKVVFTPCSSGRWRALARNACTACVGGARVARAAVLDVELEAAGGAQAGDRRRVEREGHAVLAREELRVQPLQRGERRELDGSLRSSNGLSRPNMIAGAVVLLAVDEAVAVDRAHVLHRRIGENDLLELAGESAGDAQARRVGHLRRRRRSSPGPRRARSSTAGCGT